MGDASRKSQGKGRGGISCFFSCSVLSEVPLLWNSFLRDAQLLYMGPHPGPKSSCGLRFWALMIPYSYTISPAQGGSGLPRWLSCGKKYLSAFAGTIGEMGLMPRLGRSPREGNGNPLQYTCLRNPKTEEPGRLQSTELQRVGHNWAQMHLLFFFKVVVDSWASLVMLMVKNLPKVQTWDSSSIPGSGRSGEGHGNPLWYS